MRLLHILPSIDPKLGGLVQSVEYMAAAMARCGINTEVLSLETPPRELLRNWNVKVHSPGKTFSSYGYSKELCPWLERNHSDYDAILVHGVWKYPSVGARRALCRTSTPYLIFTHGMLDPWFAQAYPLKNIKKALYWRLFEQRALRDARCVLFTCEAERIAAQRWFHASPRREQVVGMGTAAPPNAADAQLEALLAHFPHLRRQRIVLFMGRMHRVKGCDLLIRAFAEITSSDPRLHLVMAGPDQEGWRIRLERIAAELHIADRITWTGHLSGDLKWGAFRAAEVFALPSHTENYGQAIVEAMACGIPVLITDKVNIWKEIAADKAGLVAPDDLEGTIGLLKHWVSLDPDCRKAMAVNARRSYHKRFEIEGFTRRFIDYIGRAIASNPRIPERIAIYG